MGIKLKSQPSDFIVKEIASLPFHKHGEFSTYLLQKSGLNTIDVLKRISKDLDISLRDFSYGGRKDKHSVSSQYIAIRYPRLGHIKQPNYSLEFLGFMDRPMGPDLIKENQFNIVVRNLSDSDIEVAKNEIELVKNQGFSNYFDDQRFGSFDKEQGFIAEKILKGHFNGALKIYLTLKSSEDDKEERERKKSISAHWRDWSACFELARTRFEKIAFSFLEENPNGFLDLIDQIPQEELTTFFSAYQSFIWNEVLRRLLKEKLTGKCPIHPGVAGDYIFYRDLEREDIKYLEDLKIPTLAKNLEFKGALLSNIYNQVLADNGINRTLFNKLKIRRAYFKSFERSAVVKPENLSFKIGSDELSKSNNKLSLDFSLPRGSYATMLVKRLFNHA